jgi:hypothetical protein
MGDRKRPVEHKNKRQIETQRDGGGEREAANHQAPLVGQIPLQNEAQSESGRNNPRRAEREKSCGSDSTGLGEYGAMQSEAHQPSKTVPQ